MMNQREYKFFIKYRSYKCYVGMYRSCVYSCIELILLMKTYKWKKFCFLLEKEFLFIRVIRLVEI